MDARGIEDIFRPAGPVRLKRMFGGHGVYRGDRMVALEFDGVIWLKVDQQTQDAFAQAGSRPFEYHKKQGGVTVMSFWLLPEASHDDEDELRRWVRLAEEAAGRAAVAKPKRKPRSSTRAKTALRP